MSNSPGWEQPFPVSLYSNLFVVDLNVPIQAGLLAFGQFSGFCEL